VFWWRPRGFGAATRPVPTAKRGVEPHICFLERVEPLVLACSPGRKAGSGFSAESREFLVDYTPYSA
jgi:hypothetical protein